MVQNSPDPFSRSIILNHEEKALGTGLRLLQSLLGIELRLTWRAPCTQRKMAVVAWLAVSLVFFRLDLAHGLYFHMGETEKKCFIEEIPDETMVIGEFGDP